jgi:hypothetical protein
LILAVKEPDPVCIKDYFSCKIPVPVPVQGNEENIPVPVTKLFYAMKVPVPKRIRYTKNFKI